MGAPSLAVTIEPWESGAVVYGPLAAKTANDAANGQLSLVLTISNNESIAVHVYQVTVEFVGPPSVAQSTIPADTDCPPNQATQWFFAKANNIILPVPAPGGIKVSVFCTGYADPVTVAQPLAAYVSPASGGGYPFPANAEDLKPGEYWTGRSAAHGPAAGGTQLFAYDLLVRAFDAASTSWRTRPSGKDDTVNANYLAWGKPVYAMADGVVRRFKDGMPANTPPQVPDPAPKPVEGNHFYIQHGDDLALYAHFQAGTLNPALTAGPNPDGSGAPVTAGQLLGLTGNSGRSSEPHLHIQVNRTTTPWGGPPRPLPFKDMYVLELAVVPTGTAPPSQDAPWSAVAAQGLPNVTAAIWPGKLLARGFYRPWYYILIWAWIVFVGGLMITPGGVSCIVCGPFLTKVLGLVSVVAGLSGLLSRAGAAPRPTVSVERAKVEEKAELHS